MFYWKPVWIPGDGVGWATQVVLKYIDEFTEEGNEWRNIAPFDFNGQIHI